MKMTRRNALAGLGAIAAGGGALFGSGAFSQVDADRTVSVDVGADSAALVGLNPLKPDYVTETNDTIEIDLSAGSFSNADGVNAEATTTINGAFEIINNHSGSISLNDPWNLTQNNISVDLTAGSSSLSSGGSTNVDITVDTTGATSADSLSGTITITATTP